MATLGVKPIHRVEPEYRHDASGTGADARSPRTPEASPSYRVEAGGGMHHMLSALMAAGAVRVRLSMSEVRRLLGWTREAEPAAPSGETSAPGRRTSEMFRTAVAVEEWDAHERAEQASLQPHPLRWIMGTLLLGAVVFLLTMALLDAVFGTHTLMMLWRALV